VRAARLFGLAVVVGLVCVVVPALGVSSATPTAAKSSNACNREEFLSGLEAVYGRFKTHQQAVTFRARVTSRGFVNANIIEGCNEFRVVIRGIDTFDVGVDLQSEARKEGFAVTLECIQAKQIGRWDGILGHGRDRPTAQAIANRAASVGFPGAKLRNDPCGGFEVYVPGFADQREAQSWAEAARARGFPDAIAELN
jgi:hypothetical protein